MEQEPEKQEDATFQIMEMVEKDFEKRLWRIYFSRKTKFEYYLPFFTLSFYLMLFFAACYLLAQVAQAFPVVSEQPESTQIAIAISLTAAFIALASFTVNIQKVVKPLNLNEILFDYNYRVLKEAVPEENLALFKGLVILKSKHPELCLKQVLELSITKDKIFEILCK